MPRKKHNKISRHLGQTLIIFSLLLNISLLIYSYSFTLKNANAHFHKTTDKWCKFGQWNIFIIWTIIRLSQRYVCSWWNELHLCERKGFHTSTKNLYTSCGLKWTAEMCCKLWNQIKDLCSMVLESLHLFEKPRNMLNMVLFRCTYAVSLIKSSGSLTLYVILFNIINIYLIIYSEVILKLWKNTHVKG